MAITGILLGLAGLIPFLATSIGLWMLDDQRLLQVALLYGAVILSFLGGIQWGTALAAGDKQVRAGALVWSVMPALIAWGAAMSAPLYGPLLLAGGVFLAWVLEQPARLRQQLPDWYRGLRHVLTFVVVGCMLADGIWVSLRW